jgi:hypothetical protein
MQGLVRRQMALGIRNPLVFGIIWASTRFLLYTMYHAPEDSTVPFPLLLILHLDCAERMFPPSPSPPCAHSSGHGAVPISDISCDVDLGPSALVDLFPSQRMGSFWSSVHCGI